MKQIAYGVFAGVFLQVRRKMEGFLLGSFFDAMEWHVLCKIYLNEPQGNIKIWKN